MRWTCTCASREAATRRNFPAQAESLDRVADTLGMLGLNVPRRVVGEQRRIIQDIASGARPADEETLLDVAGALLYVEASLDDHIESLGADESAGMAAMAGEDEDVEASDRRKRAAMCRAARRARCWARLLREAVGNLGKVKDAIVAFIESPWDHEHLQARPRRSSTRPPARCACWARNAPAPCWKA